MKRFYFGKNWQAFSKNALTDERIDQADSSLKKLLGDVSLNGASFLDIGFGQGLTLCLASKAGAKVVGLDVDQDNLQALDETAQKVKTPKPSVVINSILDETAVKNLAQKESGFDIVHSWGVLHHTGSMYPAISNSLSLVKEGGHYILAIYNKHWTSPIWKIIKWTYCALPDFLKKIMILVFYPIIYLAKFLVTGKNPKDKDRGMDFFYDVIDWVGGYPYEYASIDEIKNFVEAKNFTCLKVVPTTTPIGCNEFVFLRK